ncbi:GPR1/FUN34/yaaH family-domain-containing protein, partial [Talaromyces proteolyticus]
GFILSLSPLSCSLMGWRGSGALGAATIGVYFFMGGLLMILAAVLEWVMGNAFNYVVFATYGGFWLSFAGTLVPSFAAYAYYAPQDENNPAAGLQTGGFQASFGE